MTERPNPFASSRPVGMDETVNEGLRAHMIRVYNYMAGALGLTGVVSFLTANSPALLSMLYNADGGMTPMGWIVMLATLGFVLFLSFKIQSMSLKTAQITFWTYAGVMGLSLTWIFLAFTSESIVQTFFITGATFMAMSLYGYTTKRDLSGLGSFLFMGLIGLIIASVVNIFLQSTMLQFIVSAAGVLIFTGLTAYDTQAIKNYYSASDSDATAGKKAIMGALRLYLDFINLFIMLLQFFGQRR